jgi:NTP pyrophosphatase (non-canonical NTP hydrolase)
MSPNEYQKAALRTESSVSIPRVLEKLLGLKTGDGDAVLGLMSMVNNGVIDKSMIRLLNGVMGMCGEAGEVDELIKKHVYQGHSLDKQHVAKELGDVAWYLAVAADAIGYDLESIFEMNIEKLKNRYPGDGFDSEHSKHRKDGDI